MKDMTLCHMSHSKQFIHIFSSFFSSQYSFQIIFYWFILCIIVSLIHLFSWISLTIFPSMTHLTYLLSLVKTIYLSECIVLMKFSTPIILRYTGFSEVYELVFYVIDIFDYDHMSLGKSDLVLVPIQIQ
jgi:hypothetical protein